MVNLTNNNIVLKQFVLLLTFILTISCAEKKYGVEKIVGKQININDKIQESAEIEKIIKPYREKIDADLNTVLSFAPETIDKSGKWQTPMGNFLSDITLEKSNAVFEKRESKRIDFCLLNNGGIRSIIPKGNVTARTAYEVMPFENSTVVLAMPGRVILEIADYIVSERKPHPLSGMTFTIGSDGKPTDIKINNQKLDETKTYYVVTSDYLANGGDNMIFFKKSSQKFDLDYKLRNIIIDYFKSHKEIIASTNQRITEL